MVYGVVAVTALDAFYQRTVVVAFGGLYAIHQFKAGFIESYRIG